MTSTSTSSLVFTSASPRAKILFLGYDQTQTSLIEKLALSNCEVWHSNKLHSDFSNFDLVISFGYRYILKKEVLKQIKVPIINLHISYLPWNRGAHPNFWSFFDGTPSGVTIHILDEGIDTGSIIYQRYVNFTKSENTFTKTHARLISEIESLFEENIEEIITKKFTTYPQKHSGTYHSAADLPVQFSGWDAIIESEMQRLYSLLIKKNRIIEIKFTTK